MRKCALCGKEGSVQPMTLILREAKKYGVHLMEKDSRYFHIKCAEAVKTHINRTEK